MEDGGNPRKDGQIGDAALQFFEASSQAIHDLKHTQFENIVAASRVCADSIGAGGLVFLFGAGHSRMMVDEMIPRQGCFVGFYPMVELSLSFHSNIVGSNGLRPTLFLEKYDGLAEEILKGFRFGPHDAFIIISTSGIRPVIVEMAMGAKARNLPVMAILSRTHSGSVSAAHHSGKKLIDVADIVIDNMTPAGDCAVALDGLDWATGPLSTITGALIINMIRCETARMLLERGHKPAMLPSHQVLVSASAEKQMEEFYEAYRKSLRHLFE